MTAPDNSLIIHWRCESKKNFTRPKWRITAPYISAPANALQLFEHPTAQESLFAIECLLQRRYLCVLTVKWRREVWFSLRFDNEWAQGSFFAIECVLHSHNLCALTINWRRKYLLKFRRSALELYFSSLRRWILMKFGIQNPYAIDKLTLKEYQNTLTEWGEIKCFVRPSGFFDKLKFQHYIIFSSLHWILKILEIQITFYMFI